MPQFLGIPDPAHFRGNRGRPSCTGGHIAPFDFPEPGRIIEGTRAGVGQHLRQGILMGLSQSPTINYSGTGTQPLSNAGVIKSKDNVPRGGVLEGG